jgi:hypothetical protein
MAGGGCLLDTLSFALMDAGDVVLVPIPYYPAFDNDLMVREPFKAILAVNVSVLCWCKANSEDEKLGKCWYI